MKKLLCLNPDCQREISVCTINTHNGNFVHPKRILNVHAVVYCVVGKMEIYIDGVPYEINTDDVYILPAGIIHYGKKACEDGTVFCATHISKDDSDSYVDKKSVPADRMILNPLIACRLNPEIKKTFLEISHIFYGSSLFAKEKLSCMITALLIDLCNIYHNEINGINTIDYVKKYIHDNISRDISAEDLASATGLKERSLRNLFVEKTGMTPYSFMRITKLQYAESLMKEHPELKVKQLAEAIGIDNEFYFSKIFRDFFGDSPSRHKKKLFEGQYLSVKSRRIFDEHSFEWTKKNWQKE